MKIIKYIECVRWISYGISVLLLFFDKLFFLINISCILYLFVFMIILFFVCECECDVILVYLVFSYEI